VTAGGPGRHGISAAAQRRGNVCQDRPGVRRLIIKDGQIKPVPGNV
jgi:hypothetical protein